jgi:hypothetical protein
LKYDMYRNSWPLLALATYRNMLPRIPGEGGVVLAQKESQRSSPATDAGASI